MKEISQQQLEQIIANAYKEFYAVNQELYKRDLQEYWHQATAYKEKKVRDAVYGFADKNIK